VAGVDDVKDELEEIIDFLKNPKSIEIDIRSQRVFCLLATRCGEDAHSQKL